MKNSGDLKSLFSGIATALNLSFVYGSSERVLNRQSSGITYPILWLENPNLRYLRSGGYKVVLESAFLVLFPCSPDDYDQIDERQDLAWKWTNHVLQKLTANADTPPPLYEFDAANTVSEPLETWSADADTGWRTEFSIIGQGCEFEDCCEG